MIKKSAAALPLLMVAITGPGTGTALFAQTLPDAGSTLQQIERNAQPRPSKSDPKSLVAPSPTENRAPSGATVTVRQFRFAGNTLLSNEQLQAVVAPWLQRELDFNELRRVAVAVAQTYRAAGWIVRADLPRQDVTDGVITIQIDEAVLGAVTVEGKEPVRLKSDHAIRIVGAQQKAGEPLNANAVDRALLLIDDLPGVTANGSLAAGAKARETDVRLALTDEPIVNGTVTLDNRGARSTGAERLDANLALNSPLGIGDQAVLNATHTRGSDYGRLAYSLPVGYDGWRVGANVSVLSYKLVASEFSALNAHGTAKSYGLDANYPIVRGVDRNLYLSLAYDHRSFDNLANEQTSSRYSLRNLTVGLSGNRYDSLYGGGFSTASLAMVAGVVDNVMSPGRPDGSDSSFRKLRVALSRQQTLTPSLSLFGALSSQFASQNLDSSERFYLGGSNGVRAYPTNEGGGASGQLINLELRYRLPQAVMLTGFYDHGWVTQYYNNVSPAGAPLTGATSPNRYSLKGYGLMVSWNPRANLLFTGTWAHRVGSNPNPTVSGNDQDGSLKKNRFWLSATVSF